MVFSAVSSVSSFDADDSVGAGQKKQKLWHIDAVRSRMKMERKNCTAKLIYPNKNGTVQYHAVSTHNLGPVHSRGGRGVLAVTVFTSNSIKYHVTCTASGVTMTEWAVNILLADQHQKQSCLAGTSTCFWTLGTEYQSMPVWVTLTWHVSINKITRYVNFTRGTWSCHGVYTASESQ